ncbi:MAG: hypothetical protein GTO63_22950 [Anaerolineae bacterium]|nr:hypothetical protein [Anaerolineae bacterium]NIN97612.1 hypothetical protein [Anaerolineae bacterium]
MINNSVIKKGESIAYNLQTSVGTRCYKPHDAGHTLFGRGVVEEMNRIGAVIDVSHGSDKTMDDAIEASRDPVIISHSFCRAISPSLRNTEDETINTLAEKGGVKGSAPSRRCSPWINPRNAQH